MAERLMNEPEKCTVCLEPFKDPRILPCCHSFCSDCLERIIIVDDKSEVQADEITCPLCKDISNVPLQGVTGFPSDYKIIQDSQHVKLRMSLSQGREKCASCSEVDVKIVGGCVKCCGVLCENCASLHKKLHIYDSHRVVDIDDVFSPSTTKVRCDIHSHEFNAYCTKCSRLICTECAIKNHKTCTGDSHVYTIEEMDKNLKDQVRDLKIIAEQKLIESVHHQETIANMEEDILSSNHTSELKEHINSSFDALQSKLKQLHSELLTKVEEKESTLKKDLWAQKNDTEMHIKKIESGLRFIKKADSCVNPAERISMSIQAQNLLKHLLPSKMGGLDSLHLPKPLIYCRTSHELSDYCGTLKELKSSDVTITMENRSDTLDVGETAVIDIQCSKCTLSTPSIRILHGVSRKGMDSSPVVYFDDDNDCWTVQFVPRCAGKHSMLVLIGGIAVSTFDFTVGGHLKRGDKVQRGPDWVVKRGSGADNLLNGTVTDLKEDVVVVRWELIPDAQESCDEMSGPKLVSSNDDKPLCIPTTLPAVEATTGISISESENIPCSEQLSEVKDSAAGFDYVTREHIWGRNGVYEVELLYL